MRGTEYVANDHMCVANGENQKGASSKVSTAQA